MKIVECKIDKGGFSSVGVFTITNFNGTTCIGESDYSHLMDEFRRQLAAAQFHEFPINGFVRCIPLRFDGRGGILCDFPGIGVESMNNLQLLDI